MFLTITAQKWYKVMNSKSAKGEVMTRLLAIAFLIALSFVLIRYRTSEKLQKYLVVTLISGFLLYTTTLMITELMR